MNVWCPKCQNRTTYTPHYYHDDKGNLIREELVCDNCHQTIGVRHYIPKKGKARWGSAIEEVK